MRCKLIVCAVAFVAALSIFALSTQTVSGQEIADVKCLMNPDKAATMEAAAGYRDAKVYFCCDHCSSSFTEDPSEFTTKANHQLLLTGQFVQTMCPITGEAVAEGITSEVAAVQIGLATEDAKKQLEAVEDIEKQVALVFADEVFEASFKLKPAYDLTDVKCFMMPKRDVKEEKFVEYMGAKVFFCCPGCVKKFNKDPEGYATQANEHLVKTGQFVQTMCPISGGEVDEEQVSEVDGQEVMFCCKNCKAKVDGAAGDAAKKELVYGAKSFEKGFSKK
jgi:YHS domain-containing protein